MMLMLLMMMVQVMAMVVVVLPNNATAMPYALGPSANLACQLSSTFNVCPNMKRFDSFNLLTALQCCSDRLFYEQNLHLSAQMRLPELDFPRFPMAAWDCEAERPDSGRLDLGCCLLSFTNKQ